MSKVYPKCKKLRTVYMTADSQILPCCDVSIIDGWKQNNISDWNLKNNDISQILDDIQNWANLLSDNKAEPFSNCSKVCGSDVDFFPYTHLELSTRCTLKCTKCPRTRGLKNGLDFKITDLNLNDAKSIIEKTDNVLISLCGTLGDPIFHPNLIEIIQYIESREKVFILSTAAPGKTLNWWKKFYTSYNSNISIVRFGLDGLEDTAHLYRVGTDYNKVFSAMKLGVKLGKRIQWQFIPFKFNEHQVHTVEQICKENGIEFYMLKSNRWKENDPLEPVNKELKLTARGY
jgi:MoaA/NifB/PqqE/SkfB family radical SAM enzyme